MDCSNLARATVLGIAEQTSLHGNPNLNLTTSASISNRLLDVGAWAVGAPVVAGIEDKGVVTVTGDCETDAPVVSSAALTTGSPQMNCCE